MAIVADLSGNNPTDQDHYTHSRALSQSPVAYATPAFVGEIVLDRNGNQLWRAVGTANTDWVVLQITKRAGAVSL